MTTRSPSIGVALRRLREALRGRRASLDASLDETDPQQIVLIVDEGGARRVIRRLDAVAALALAADLCEGRGILERVV